MKISKHQRILNQIAAIRGAHSQIREIFLYGSCLSLFCILRSFYPEAEAYWNLDHVITKIDGKFYDITGRVDPKGYKPITEFYNKRRTSRSFTQMMKSEISLRGCLLNRKAAEGSNTARLTPAQFNLKRLESRKGSR